jgi:hypothetical protein
MEYVVIIWSPEVATQTNPEAVIALLVDEQLLKTSSEATAKTRVHPDFMRILICVSEFQSYRTLAFCQVGHCKCS